MDIKNVFKTIIFVLSVLETVLVTIWVMIPNTDSTEIIESQPVMAEVVIVKPHENVNTLNNESILTPIEECDNNPRACRWAQGERKELSVLRYTQTRDNLVLSCTEHSCTKVCWEVLTSPTTMVKGLAN